MKIKFTTLCASIVGAMMLQGPLQAADYPARDIQGTIMWGAGGATDTLARVVSPAVEKELGTSIVLVNRAGGSGAISTQYVDSKPADGYNLLMGSETPQTHKVLGISELDYDQFDPVIVYGTNIIVFAVKADAKWQTMQELIDDIKARPGQISAAVTGPGGGAQTALGIVNVAEKLDVNMVPFPGEGPGLTAVQGGHADFMPTSLPAVTEQLRAGTMRALAVLYDTPVSGFEEIPLITRNLPTLDKYLPWGTFQGVLVKKGTPPETMEKLSRAYLAAVKTPEVAAFIKKSGMQPLNLTGQEARDFLDNWRAITSWVLYDVGDAKISPETFGIPRP